MALSTRVSGKSTTPMETGDLSTPTVMCTQDNSRMVSHQDRARVFMWMELSIKVSEKMACETARVPRHGQMVLSTQAATVTA